MARNYIAFRAVALRTNYVFQLKQVRLTFDNFDIEVVQNDECSYDNVAIYESYVSATTHGKLLGR